MMSYLGKRKRAGATRHDRRARKQLEAIPRLLVVPVERGRGASAERSIAPLIRGGASTLDSWPGREHFAAPRQRRRETFAAPCGSCRGKLGSRSNTLYRG